MERPAIQWPEPEREEDLLLEQSVRAVNAAIITVGTGAHCDYSSLSDALAAASDGDTIRLTKNGDYLGQTYLLQNFSGELTIRGGYESCASNDRSGRTKLDANSTGRLFNINRSSADTGPLMDIRLMDLELVRGDAGDGYLWGGGGLLVNGPPGRLRVTLENVWVTNNRTNTIGGGIHVRMNADRSGTSLPILTLDNDSFVAQNKAGEDGGGIACSSNGFFPGAETLIRLGAGGIVNNEADGHGGGLFLDGCRNVWVYGGLSNNPLAAIVMNTAGERGGGVAMINQSVATITGNSFGEFGDNQAGAAILGNEAQYGGGIYMDTESTLSLFDVYLENNMAHSTGGGAYSKYSNLRIRRSENEPCQPVSGLHTPRCSYVRGNKGGGHSDQARALEHRHGHLEISRTIISGHAYDSPTGDERGFVIVLRDASSVIEGALFQGNHARRGIFHLWDDSDLKVSWSTFAKNANTSIVRMRNGSNKVQLLGSIMHDVNTSGNPTKLFTFYQGVAGDHDLLVDCVIAAQPQGDLPISAHYYSEIDPHYVDADNGDFHLAHNSPAIDYCDGYHAPEHRDLDGNERGVPHMGPTPIAPPNPYPGGTFDLGAYEMHYVSDKIFSDRFEDN